MVLKKRGIHRNPKTVLRIMKLYLSMIRDLNDNSIVAYKTGTEQTVNLVLDTIRLAMKLEKKRVAAELQLHSDQGSLFALMNHISKHTQFSTTGAGCRTLRSLISGR